VNTDHQTPFLCVIKRWASTATCSTWTTIHIYIHIYRYSYMYICTFIICFNIYVLCSRLIRRWANMSTSSTWTTIHIYIHIYRSRYMYICTYIICYNIYVLCSRVIRRWASTATCSTSTVTPPTPAKAQAISHRSPNAPFSRVNTDRQTRLSPVLRAPTTSSYPC